MVVRVLARVMVLWRLKWLLMYLGGDVEGPEVYDSRRHFLLLRAGHWSLMLTRVLLSAFRDWMICFCACVMFHDSNLVSIV